MPPPKHAYVLRFKQSAMKVGRYCVSSSLCRACLVMSVQALSFRAIASAGGYLGLVCDSSCIACVTSCNLSSLHRCRYLAIRAQPRGKPAKLLTVRCKLCNHSIPATAQRLPHAHDPPRSSRPPKLTKILFVYAQCLEAEFYSWVANGKGLSSDVAGTFRIMRLSAANFDYAL